MFSLFHRWRQAGRTRPVAPPRFRPQVESLECLCVPSASQLSPLPAPFQQVFQGDFNGDGVSDVAGFTTDGKWQVSLSNTVFGGTLPGGTLHGTGFQPRTQWAQWSVPSTWRQLFVGDFDGDGKADVLGFGNNGACYVGVSTGTSFATRLWARWSVGSTWSQLFVADFAGDSATDIAGFAYDGSWWVGTSNRFDQVFSTSIGPWARWAIPGTWSQLFVADFDHDFPRDRPDIAGFAKDGSWWVGLNTGASFVTGARWAQWSPASLWGEILVGDFNGDSQEDIAGLDVTGGWWVGLSDAAGTFVTGLRWGFWSPPSSWAKFLVTDFNLDGQDDILGFGFNGTWWAGISNDSNSAFSTGAPWAYWALPSTWSRIETGDFRRLRNAIDLVAFRADRTWWVGGPVPFASPSLNQWGDWNS